MILLIVNTDKIPPTIVFFDFVTHFGGAQQCTVLLCSELKKSYEVHVIDAYGFCDKYLKAMSKCGIQPTLLVPGAKYIYIGSKGKPLKRMWSFIKQIPTLLKLHKRIIQKIRQLNPDAIWTNSTKALAFLETSMRLRKYPIVMYAHGWYRKSQVPARWLIKKADCVLAVSNPTAEALESWGVRKEKIHIVYNSIDFDAIMKDSQKEPLTSPPQKDKPFKILLPAQLLRTKGQHTAIEAARILEGRGLDFVMWLAGDVKMGVGDDYRLYLEKTISNYGLEDNVFLLGIREDILALMRLSDIVILPTYTEGLPRTIEESMILRRPVISTAVGGVTDLITNGETGLIFPVDDAEALAQSIEKLMLDKQLYDKIAQEAYQRIHKKFSLDKHVEAVQTAFEKTIKSTGDKYDKRIG